MRYIYLHFKLCDNILQSEIEFMTYEMHILTTMKNVSNKYSTKNF